MTCLVKWKLFTYSQQSQKETGHLVSVLSPVVVVVVVVDVLSVCHHLGQVTWKGDFTLSPWVLSGSIKTNKWNEMLCLTGYQPMMDRRCVCITVKMRSSSETSPTWDFLLFVSLPTLPNIWSWQTKDVLIIIIIYLLLLY